MKKEKQVRQNRKQTSRRSQSQKTAALGRVQTIRVSMPKAMRSAVVQAAAKSGQTPPQFIEQAIRKFLPEVERRAFLRMALRAASDAAAVVEEGMNIAIIRGALAMALEFAGRMLPRAATAAANPPGPLAEMRLVPVLLEAKALAEFEVIANETGCPLHEVVGVAAHGMLNLSGKEWPFLTAANTNTGAARPESMGLGKGGGR
jgi:hypothetical protein